MVKIIFKLHFLQAKYAFKGLLLNCPDIMFNVIEDPLIFKDDFTSLAKKFNVYAVNLWSDYNFIYNSTDIQRKCEKTIGLILSPACIEVLPTDSGTVNKITQFLNSGTVQFTGFRIFNL